MLGLEKRFVEEAVGTNLRGRYASLGGKES